MLPQAILIDGTTGHLAPFTGRYQKRLSELERIFQDEEGRDRDVRMRGDPLVYEVMEYREEGSDLFFGTTTIFPGKVGNEFYMTRGHFHRRRDMAEVYYTHHGTGVLLLESRTGQSELVEMHPGLCAFIPPDWAHRSINVGDDRLVFVWVCNPQAGHDYAEISSCGMRRLVVDDPSGYRVVDNPSFRMASP